MTGNHSVYPHSDLGPAPFVVHLVNQLVDHVDAPAVGAMNKYLTGMITNPAYNKVREVVKEVLHRTPGAVGDVMDTGQIWHATIEAEGDGRFGQALGAVVTGDFVSVYLAFMYAIDPTPVDVITHIKEQMALADQAEDE